MAATALGTAAYGDTVFNFDGDTPENIWSNDAPRHAGRKPGGKVEALAPRGLRVFISSLAQRSGQFNTLGTATNFTDKVNGLSATFSSAGDPGGFAGFPVYRGR